MRRAGRIWLLASVSAAVFATPAGATLFTNTTPIDVPACHGGDCSTMGVADPYPSTISVSGLPPTVQNVTVALRGINHTGPDDIDALLVGPGGRAVLLMSDACAGTPLTGQTLFFNDTGPPLPATGPCPNGTYKPTDYPPADNFGPTAPSPPYGTSLSAFTGEPANGLWRLFVVDDGNVGVGTISGGWRLELLPQVSCAGKPATVAANVGTPGDDVINGTPGPDVIFGLGGNDTINGEGGNDVICGGPGNDKLVGGPGRDLLRGQGGRDKLKGQGGKDTCVGGPKHDTAKSCETDKSI